MCRLLPPCSSRCPKGSCTRTSSVARRGCTAGACSRSRTSPRTARIIAYTGEKISHKESLARESRYLDDGSIWCFLLNRRWVIDGHVGGNDARFINHSCAPNCYTQIIDGMIWVRAARSITSGEELTYNYYTEGEGQIRVPVQARLRRRCCEPCRAPVLPARLRVLGRVHQGAFLARTAAPLRRATARTRPQRADFRALDDVADDRAGGAAIAGACRRRPVVLIGSSLGAFVAWHVAARAQRAGSRSPKLVLLAPALDFGCRRMTGLTEAECRRLARGRAGASFTLRLRRCPGACTTRCTRTRSSTIHGGRRSRRRRWCSWAAATRWSRRRWCEAFCAARPTSLVWLEDEHQLAASLDGIWSESAAFVGLSAVNATACGPGARGACRRARGPCSPSGCRRPHPPAPPASSARAVLHRAAAVRPRRRHRSRRHRAAAARRNPAGSRRRRGPDSGRAAPCSRNGPRCSTARGWPASVAKVFTLRRGTGGRAWSMRTRESRAEGVC